MEAVVGESRLGSAEAKRVIGRFVWKEVRMLRGLAVGVVGLTLVVMALLRALLPGDLVPTWMLISAFAGAALFAVAATVTLFAVEREMGTTVFVELLPQNRVALFVGKVAAAAGLTLLVAMVLVAATYLAGLWPSGEDARVIVPQGIVAILEAFSYGLLMSLLCPNPLLAAVLAMAAASLNSQLAMALSMDSANGFMTREFQIATPTRLMLVSLVGALDVWLGLNWLQSLSAPRRRAREANAVKETPVRPRKLGMFGRLMWQSIRQSWKSILAVTAIGLLLMFAADLVLATLLGSVSAMFERYVFISLLFLPALYGALAFRADQRQRQYRFLAEHAGQPRMVWLSRQLTWLTPTIVWCAVVSSLSWSIVGSLVLDGLRSASRGGYAFGLDSNGQLSTAMRMNIEMTAEFWFQVTVVFWMASLAAYAVGQFFSLALRSDVFAGLLSLGGSVLILGWAYLAIDWQLPPLWCIGPPAAGLMWASWLRGPDWLADRLGLRAWVWPALVAMASAVAALVLVPLERAAQVSERYPAPSIEYMRSTLEHERRLNELAAGGAQHAIETRSRFRDAFARANQLAPLLDSPSADGYSIEALGESVMRANAVGREVSDEYIKLADDMRATDFTPNEEFDTRVIEASRQPCRLPLGEEKQWDSRGKVHSYAQSRAKALRSRDLAAALELLLAARRIEAQLSSPYYGWGATVQSDSAKSLVAWATAPGQSPELILRAVEELGEINRNWPTPVATVMDSYLDTQAVIRGESASALVRAAVQRGDDRSSLPSWFAILKHQFPGESSRAERALDILAAFALDYFAGLQVELEHIDSVATSPSADVRRLQAAEEFRERLSRWRGDDVVSMIVSDGLGGGPVIEERAKLVRAAQTSRLGAAQFIHPAQLFHYAAEWIDGLVQRRAERVRLALIAYRVEHGEYPLDLKQLTPKYLAAAEIVDPYAAEPFQYRPQGFEKWACRREGVMPRDCHPPHTPLLWSVGPSAAVPTETKIARASDEPQAEMAAEVILTLQGTPDRERWGAFWMSLPTDSPAD